MFGVALAIFIYAANTELLLSNTQALLLYVTSFLLMLRFWWRYTELFVQFLPSRNYLQFLFDFLISLLGILTVLYVSAVQTWAALGAAVMLASLVRCLLSWHDSKDKKSEHS